MIRAGRHLLLLLSEIGRYAWEYRAWWIVPVTILLLLSALLVVVAGKTAPLIYAIF